MKKISIIGLLVIFVFLIFYCHEKKQYDQNYSTLKRKILIGESAYFIPDEWFYRLGEFPENMDQIVTSLLDNESDEEDINYFLTDPFNLNKEYFKYIPLYSKINKRREGYILLSAGLDGKIDNVIKDNDTMYIEDHLNLKLYDSSDTSFNIIERILGNKDLLINEAYGRQMIIDNAVNIDIEDLIRNAKSLKTNDFLWNILIRDKIEIMDSLFYFCHDNIWIKNYPIEYDLIDPYQINDSISFAGIFRGWENDTTIKIINCIPVK